MPIAVTCRCGKSYNLKDEYASKVVRCPACGENIRVEAPQVTAQKQVDPVFDRDKFLLRQKLAISEKYLVWDEQGRTILYIERPRYLFRNAFAVLTGIFTGIIVGIIFGVLASAIPFPPLQVLLGILAVVGGLATVFVVSIVLYKKRHITFYRDDAKQERLLEILQDQKFLFLIATYTLLDPDGQLLARFRKNYLYNIFRKRWYCYASDGSMLCIAKEDSIILSLLRRFLGTFFGILRTNFIILDGRERNVIGEFNRKFTILDRYVLDMSNDPARLIDRRIALALGVMLDTGERR